MASNVSTVDGMGFEEVNQGSFTEVISGTFLYISQDAEIGDSLSARTVSANGNEVISTSYQNAADVYGMRVRAGSVKIGNSSSGLILFADDWVGVSPGGEGDYFITLTPQNWTLPVANTTGSITGFSISGTRRASGCWAYGPSGTVADWIAVGV